MLTAFKEYIRKENLFHPTDKVMLAVSGGIDSVAMAELFSRSGFSFGIAHCNFQLRGNDSNEDELFVSRLAGKLKVPFFSKRFSTTSYKDLKGISVQMAARELRYSWFNELLTGGGYAYLATAHHLDDQIETFFINMMRSTGIAGFHGIIPKQGNIIRPMLFASRELIGQFVNKNGIAFREDRSNQEVKYLRNKIRHELLPVLSEMNPNYRTILTENIYRVREAEKIFRESVEKIRTKQVKTGKIRTLVSIEGIMHLNPLTTYLFELLSPFGFNYPVVCEISNSLSEEPGKQFFSTTHRLIKDRDHLIITSLPTNKTALPESSEFLITEKAKLVSVPVKLSLRKMANDPDFRIDPSPEVANLDLHKITFPLALRKWKKGDAFIPYGRNHRKKVSDFFTDCKLSIDLKENVWILCSGEKIVWIVGHRIDNRFRITPKTKQVLQIRWTK